MPDSNGSTEWRMPMRRWLALQLFKFKVTHKLGTQMAVADFLSPGEEVGYRPDSSPAWVWQWGRLQQRCRLAVFCEGERTCWWLNRGTCVWLMNKWFVFSEQLEVADGSQERESTVVCSVAQACLPFPFSPPNQWVMNCINTINCECLCPENIRKHTALALTATKFWQWSLQTSETANFFTPFMWRMHCISFRE